MPSVNRPDISAILFDLDGTLLESRMHLFLPAYYRALWSTVSHLSDYESFVGHLRRATFAMVSNDGSRTNEEAFSEVFYPFEGRVRDELQPLFDEFYRAQYPALRDIVSPIPGSREAVVAAFGLGYQVAIATNPLFPATAIEQRLDWAGVADLPFGLVTSYENSRASKPSPLYYHDVCTALGRQPSECLVIGDEDWDIAAGEIGCRTFLVPGEATTRNPLTHVPDHTGSLADAVEMIRCWKKG